MYGIMEEIRNEGIIEGEIKGRQEGKAEMACEMVKQGMSIKMIAKIANVDMATINEWLVQRSSLAE